ncbi:hypothetical protein HanIR_Chr10g0472901 [Helianthus annuus]|nr:hypothetical protein HanIR_Chr10g0472901 [Helianthus annuus]
MGEHGRLARGRIAALEKSYVVEGKVGYDVLWIDSKSRLKALKEGHVL